MDKAFVEKMNIQLSEMKHELIETLMSENDEFKSIIDNMGPKDLADIAADDVDRTNLEAIGTTELKRFRKIDSALARIKNGKYGRCLSCGELIPKARLEAIPYAMFCIECQSSDERKTRQG